MAGTLYTFELFNEDIPLYLIEYTPSPFVTSVKVSLTEIDGIQGQNNTTLLFVCSSTEPIFYLEDDPNTPILATPFIVNNEGECGAEPEPEPPTEYTLSINVQPVLSGTTTGAGTYIEGDFVTVTATPESGFVFVNWAEGSTVLSTSSSYSFSMPNRNLTLTANFVSDEPTPDPDPVPPTTKVNGYDENCQRFVLINNPESTILPEDIIDLNDFQNKFLLEDEPEGFDTAVIELVRDAQTHGFIYEYSLESLLFSCEYGKQYLETIFEEQGTDADVKFVYGVGTVEDFNVLYVGRLDFNEYALENAEYVKMNIRNDDFRTLLQNSFDIPQQIEPTDNVLLYSKVIPRKITYTIPKPDQVVEGQVSYPVAYKDPSTGLFIGRESPTQYILVNDGREGDSDAEIFPTYDFQIDPNLPRTDGAGYKYLFRAKEAGLYKIKVRTTLRFIIGSIEGWGNFIQDQFNLIKLNLTKTESDGQTVVSQETFTTDRLTSFSPISGGHLEFEFEKDIEVDINVEECYYLFFTLDTSKIPSLRTINVTEARPFQGDFNIPQISIVAETLAPSSTTKFISPINAFNSVFKQASEVEYDLIKSDYLTTGCASKLYLTNGFGVRNFIEQDRNILKLSPEQLFKHYQTIFNLGWGVEYDGFRQELIRIEDTSYFYQDTEILSLEDDLISDYEVVVDPSKYYNQIEVGFNKFSKQRETDKGNTLDDPHSRHTYQTPIKTNKNKLTLLSDLILSGYELEILRRKQFSKEGEDENANYREDEDIFGVQLLNKQFYSGASFSGLLTDLSSGNIINLTENSIIVEGFAYFYQGQQINVKVDNNLSKLNSVLNIEFGRFTPIGFSFSVFGTRIVFTNNIDSTGAPLNPQVVITTVDGEAYVVPEANQPFENVSNLISPQSAYNLRYTPKRIMLNWANLFNGGFRTKDSNELIKFKVGDGNLDLSTRFSSAETCRLGDSTRATIVEGSNISLSSTFGGDYLFLPYKVSFSYPLSFEELNYIRRAMRGISEDNNNYGYLTYINPKGNTEKLFVTSIKFKPSEGEADIEGYIKDFSV